MIAWADPTTGRESPHPTRLYGNLADAVLGDRRYRNSRGDDALWRKRAALRRRATLRPVVQVTVGLVLLVSGLVAFALLGGAQEHLFARAPGLDDVERWLAWREWRP